MHSMNMNRKGFTFVELLVAMTLLGIVSTAVYSLMRSNQRVYREQAAHIDLNQNVRAAVNILPAELRELDTSDPAGSDISAMDSASLTYHQLRSLYFLCQPPNTGGQQVTVWKDSLHYGISPIASSDSLFILFADNDPNSRTDDLWLRAKSTTHTAGTACPLLAPSITLTLTGVTAADLGGVIVGAPIRGYKTVTVGSYADANGEYWIGSKDSAGTYQPLVGPLASATGLRFSYYDAAGVATTSKTAVARIQITVTGRSQDKVQGSSGYVYATQQQVTQVALRNNRRW